MSGEIRTVCIIADGFDATQEAQVNHVLKTSADHWWHQIPNVWFAVSIRNANQWYRELRNIALPSETLICVEVKPSKDGTHPGAAFRGPKSTVDWFQQRLTASDIVPF